MNINEIMEYCRVHNCNAFAINENNHEIFELSFTKDDPEVDEFNIFYSHDDGSENCSWGEEECFSIEEALLEFPYFKTLHFSPISKEISVGHLNYYYATIELKKSAISI